MFRFGFGVPVPAKPQVVGKSPAVELAELAGEAGSPTGGEGKDGTGICDDAGPIEEIGSLNEDWALVVVRALDCVGLGNGLAPDNGTGFCDAGLLDEGGYINDERTLSIVDVFGNLESRGDAIVLAEGDD